MEQKTLRDSSKAYEPPKLICGNCGKKLKDYRSKLCRSCWIKIKPFITNGFKSKDENINWKDNPSYRSIHHYIRRNKPKKNYCEICKDRNKKLVVANISKKYTRDFNDYIWLCVKCHNYYDGTVNNLNKAKNGGAKTKTQNGNT